MAYRSLTFDTEVVQPINGIPPGVAYASGSQHYINKVYVLKQNASPLKIDMTVGSPKTEIFGESLAVALLADKPMTFGSPSSGSDVETWKSWYKPAISVSQATAADRPSYYRVARGGGAGGPAIVLAPGEFLDLPSANFNFGATDQWTIFVALETVTQNSNDEGHLFGGTSTGGDFSSIWGIDNDKCAVIDQNGNEELWSGSLMTNNCVRMLSHSASKEVWDYMNGEEVLNNTSTFTRSFDFDFLNKSETTSGTAGSATFWVREILIYEESIDVMGATQRQEIEGYLAHKWGTNSSLLKADGTTGHPYVTTDPRDAEDWKFSSALTTTKSGYVEATPPSLSSFTDTDYDIHTFGQGTNGFNVAANQLVKFAVVDMEKPGKVYIRVEYTGA